MAFSEAELVFLALIFIFTLVFLSLGKRNNVSTAKNKKNEEKGEEKSDTPEALPRPSAQDSTRT